MNDDNIEVQPNTQKSVDVIVDSGGREPESSIAGSFIPFPFNDNKAIYLSYLACGLSPREALQLTGIHKSTLSWYRTDPKFAETENKIPEIRKQLAKEYTQSEYYRNFRLVLEKDSRVLKRSLGMELDSYNKPIPMTSEDREYLLKLRAYYTPQHLAALESITKAGATGFNFAAFVAANQDIVEISRTDTIKMKKE